LYIFNISWRKKEIHSMNCVKKSAISEMDFLALFKL